MLKYLGKRLLLLVPTLFIILFINFIIVQFTPGGPVEQELSKLKNAMQSQHMAAQDISIDDRILKELHQKYGFDKPISERFWIMIKSYLRFDFGNSYLRNSSVKDLIIEKLPVSISLGLWSTLLTYLISIPLGVAKAVRNNSKFDMTTTLIVSFFYAFPTFVLGLGLIMIFGPSGVFPIFPGSGFMSYNFDQLSFPDKITDYIHHITLPVISIVLSTCASSVFLTKNCFAEELSKQYLMTAKAKGASSNQVLYGHVFRNAMIIIIASLPAALVGIFLTGSLLTEIIFSLDGLGKLSYESAINRDYPVVFGLLFVFTLTGLVANIISDILFTIVDPRINFDAK